MGRCPCTRGRVWIQVTGVVIRPSGEVAVRGRRGDSSAWYERDRTGELRRIDVPATALPQWSEDGESFAYQDGSGGQWMLHIVARSGRRVLPLARRASAVAWYPDGTSLLVMLPDRDGLSSLHRVNARTGEMSAVAHELDAGVIAPAIAVAPDGRRVYIALASPGVAAAGGASRPARGPRPRHLRGGRRDRPAPRGRLDAGR